MNHIPSLLFYYFFSCEPVCSICFSTSSLCVFICCFLIPSCLCSRLHVYASEDFPGSLPSIPNGITWNSHCQSFSFHHPSSHPLSSGKYHNIHKWNFLKIQLLVQELNHILPKHGFFSLSNGVEIPFYFMKASTKANAAFLTSSIDWFYLAAFGH